VGRDYTVLQFVVFVVGFGGGDCILLNNALKQVVTGVFRTYQNISAYSFCGSSMPVFIRLITNYI
jgi:hypothetical protein